MTIPSNGGRPTFRGSVVGVDIGGTKTHIVQSASGAADSEVLADLVVPSSSWRGELGDVHADSVRLRDLLVDRLGRDILGTPLAVGAHGCDTTEQCSELERALEVHFDAYVHVVNDSELMAPAMGLDEAIGLVVGTGSIATARNKGGELITAGGWGWLLGDEGSAPALVREAVRAVLLDLDRGNPADALGTRLQTVFGARSGAELALAVTQNASSEEWGIHAPHIFAAADEGSAIAVEVIEMAGARLGELIGQILERGADASVAVAGGSVIQRQPRLQASVRAALERDRIDVELQILNTPPVIGAVALARRSAGNPTHQLRTERSSK